MIGFSFILILFGTIMAGICGILPVEVYIFVPFSLKIVLFMFGIVLAIAGYMMLIIRALQTTAIHLLKRGRPGFHTWFYIHSDGTAQFTPSIRAGESQTYNKELDAQVPNTKTYRLADHNICIVPECVGAGVDLDYALYIELAQSKYGFETLKEGRKSALDIIGIHQQKEIVGEENVAVRGDIKKISDRALAQKRARSDAIRKSV